MFRNLYFYTIFFVTLFPFYLAFILPVWTLRLLAKKETERFFVKRFSLYYFRFVMNLTGSRITVKGFEHLPDSASDSICLVSNHQSYFDILLIEAYIPFLVGFVAKKELGRLPILRTWMKELGCVLIDRRSSRSAVEAISRGVASIKNGNPLVLFPEGTRSRSQKMNVIKPGSLKLAIRSQALIVPITINHSYKIYEESGRVKAADVSMIIHEPINMALEESTSQELAEKLQKIIEGSLEEG